MNIWNILSMVPVGNSMDMLRLLKRKKYRMPESYSITPRASFFYSLSPTQ